MVDILVATDDAIDRQPLKNVHELITANPQGFEVEESSGVSALARKITARPGPFAMAYSLPNLLCMMILMEADGIEWVFELLSI